jgi:hypothetical protein
MIFGFGMLALTVSLAAFSIRRSIEKSNSGTGPSTTLQGEVRAQAVTEAIRREPSLANANSPDELARLDALVTDIQREMTLKMELEIAQRTKRREDSWEARKHARKIEDSKRMMLAKERAARIHSKYPDQSFLRTVLLHPWLTAILAISLLILITWLGTSLTSA